MTLRGLTTRAIAITAATLVLLAACSSGADVELTEGESEVGTVLERPVVVQYRLTQTSPDGSTVWAVHELCLSSWEDWIEVVVDAGGPTDAAATVGAVNAWRDGVFRGGILRVVLQLSPSGFLDPSVCAGFPQNATILIDEEAWLAHQDEQQVNVPDGHRTTPHENVFDGLERAPNALMNPGFAGEWPADSGYHPLEDLATLPAGLLPGPIPRPDEVAAALSIDTGQIRSTAYAHEDCADGPLACDTWVSVYHTGSGFR